MSSPAFAARPGMKRTNTTAQQLFAADHTNPEDVRVFARALHEIAHEEDTTGVERLSATPDWAPIKQRIRRGRRRNRDVVREGWAYHLARWPLLFFIGLAIALEFIAYILVRQIVNLSEWIWHFRGQRGRFRAMMRSATTYEQWKQAALKMDDHLGLTPWKRASANAYYDHVIIRRVRQELRELRTKGDVEGVATVLMLACRSNFAGSENAALYSECYLGTKTNIEEFVDEMERSLRFIRMSDQMSTDEKHKFFRSLSKGYGSTALCLSGGASFGYYHFGVLSALLDAGLLPRIITGTSAGSLIAAFACTYNDDELRKMLTPDLAQKIDACAESIRVWLPRFIRTGARFDGEAWAAKCQFFTRGSMTFKEAFERTGRVLNVSVIPYATHAPTKLLNHLTAPDCLIFSAVLASAAVPGILQPVTLLIKRKNGTVEPWSFAGRHKDGSLRVDIPLDALHSMFNCSFSIVSQVNPHIHLLSFKARGAPGRPVSHRGGRGWRGGFFLSACERFLKIEMMKNFQVVRDLELLPEFAGQNWSQIFLQKYDGTVTVHPRSRVLDWLRILSDPDEAELARMINIGKHAIWPRMRMISNRLRIENQIDGGRDDARRALPGGGASFAYSPLPTDVETDLLDSASDLDLGPSQDVRRAEHDDDEDDEDGTEAPSKLGPPSSSSIPPVTVSFAGSTTGSMTKARRRELMKRLGIDANAVSSPPGRRPSVTRDDDSDMSSPSTAPLRTWRSAPPTLRKSTSGALRRPSRTQDEIITSDDDGPLRVSGGIFG